MAGAEHRGVLMQRDAGKGYCEEGTPHIRDVFHAVQKLRPCQRHCLCKLRVRGRIAGVLQLACPPHSDMKTVIENAM